MALLHHMTYPQAREAFEQVLSIDPRCAMAHWGLAMTLFQPLWPTRPSPDALRRGWAAVEAAKALQPPTERERLFVATAEAFFLAPAPKYPVAVLGISPTRVSAQSTRNLAASLRTA